MKLKLKALAAALPLLAAAHANAAISIDNLAAGPAQGTGAGELFLSVIDRNGTAPESYVRDLGALGTTGSILSNPSAFNPGSIAADANLQSLLSNAASDGGSIYWQISGINNAAPNIGALTTSATPLNSGNVPQGGQGFNLSFTSIQAYVNSVNQLADPSNPTDYTANLSVLVPSSNSGAYYDGLNFGSNWLDPANTEAGIGQSMGFYFVQPLTGTTSAVTPFASRWTLGADGTLTYAPLPPAVWLLGSALVGLVGVGRRRTTPAV